MDRLLKRVQRVRPDAFCSRDFVLLHDNAPSHKAASGCQFLTQNKCYNPLSPPVLYRFISARLISVPQEAVTDELKKVQKQEFSAALQKLYDHTKACIYAN